MFSYSDSQSKVFHWPSGNELCQTYPSELIPTEELPDLNKMWTHDPLSLRWHWEKCSSPKSFCFAGFLTLVAFSVPFSCWLTKCCHPCCSFKTSHLLLITQRKDPLTWESTGHYLNAPLEFYTRCQETAVRTVGKRCYPKSKKIPANNSVHIPVCLEETIQWKITWDWFHRKQPPKYQ